MEEGIEDAWLEGWKLGLAIPERERQDRIGMNRRGLFVQPPVVEGEEVECAAALGVTDVGSVVVKQLGIATEILIAPLSAVAGALTLSAGLAVALGARPIVTHILAGHFLRQSLRNESVVVVQGEQGQVERVGPTETRLRNDSKSWTIPNGQLLDDVVIRL